MRSKTWPLADSVHRRDAGLGDVGPSAFATLLCPTEHNIVPTPTSMCFNVVIFNSVGVRHRTYCGRLQPRGSWLGRSIQKFRRRRFPSRRGWPVQTSTIHLRCRREHCCNRDQMPGRCPTASVCGASLAGRIRRVIMTSRTVLLPRLRCWSQSSGQSGEQFGACSSRTELRRD